MAAAVAAAADEAAVFAAEIREVETVRAAENAGSNNQCTYSFLAWAMKFNISSACVRISGLKFVTRALQRR